ncbi:MAG: Gfo/Idh/MocA family oxidoreductase [bacterium]|nr:Gfo/Idh/MocA family oxidoreductase [bacterium]
MNKLNVAVIGAGNMGRHHARIYSELPNINLAAICDIDVDNGEKLAKKHGCRFYRDYKQMLVKEKIDAVSIAVPTFLHHEVAFNVLDKGINVLLEKPIATSLSEGEDIIKKAKEKSVLLMVGHIERFNPAVRRLARLIHDNKLGDIVSINMRRVGGLPPQKNNANVIMDLAIHDIDIANFFMRDFPVEVSGYKSKITIDEQEDNAFVLLKYPKASAFIEVNWITPIKIRTLDITGTKGFARLDYVAQKITLYENVLSAGNTQYKDFNDFISKFYSPTVLQVDVERAEPLKCELEEFIGAIAEKREPVFTAHDAYKSLEIALKI